MSDLSNLIHTYQLGKIQNNTNNSELLQSAILYELKDLKHLKKTGRTLKEQAERDAELDAIIDEEERIEESIRWNSLSDDEKYAEDFSQYKFGCVFTGVIIQLIAQICIFNIEVISSVSKNIIILEISVILFHAMLQYYNYISFNNNWRPKRK